MCICTTYSKCASLYSCVKYLQNWAGGCSIVEEWLLSMLKHRPTEKEKEKEKICRSPFHCSFQMKRVLRLLNGLSTIFTLWSNSADSFLHLLFYIWFSYTYVYTHTHCMFPTVVKFLSYLCVNGCF